MISQIITQYIDTHSPSLTTGDNIFTEKSVGDQTVTIITKDLAPWLGMDENFRQAIIEVEVKGYKMAEAHSLSEDVLSLILGMVGNADQGSSYSFRTIQSRQLPCYRHDGTVTFSFRISYVVEGE